MLLYTGDDLYFGDWGNYCIRKVAISTGIVADVAGTCTSSGYLDGSAAVAKFAGVRGSIKFMGTDLWIADTNNHVIRVLSTTNSTVSTAAGERLCLLSCALLQLVSLSIASSAGSSEVNSSIDGPALSGAAFRAPLDVALYALTNKVHAIESLIHSFS